MRQQQSFPAGLAGGLAMVCLAGAQHACQPRAPVDLAGPIPAGAGALDIQWQPAEAHMVDNGHNIQVDVAEGSSITLEGRHFSLLQFHFHLPGEHAVDGDAARYPMNARPVQALNRRFILLRQ